MTDQKTPDISVRNEENKDILGSDRYERAETIRHHNTSVAVHSRKTAEYGERICRWLKRRGVRISEEDVVRACLLHDIGMTEQNVHETVSWKKAYLHPQKGEQIAKTEYRANEIQRNAIRRHMWPICIIPPKYKEGWVVVAADKCSSIWEIVHAVIPGRGRKRRGRKHRNHC